MSNSHSYAPNQPLTAAQTARFLREIGFNWLDIECVLELAPSQKSDGHTRYQPDKLQRFINRAFWLNEQPVDFEIPRAA